MYSENLLTTESIDQELFIHEQRITHFWWCRLRAEKLGSAMPLTAK